MNEFSNTTKAIKNTYTLNNPVRSLVENNLMNKKRKVSANKSNHSTIKGTNSLINI
jgi:hypothetical protein